MNKGKLILALLIMAAAIIAMGMFYSVYAYLTKASFHILNTDVPGFVFGLIAIFLGMRYLRALGRLKKKISSPETTFSWNNFKKVHSI